jgi:hypothetical protein
MDNFFIRSIEHRTYHAKHRCTVREIVDGNKLLVETSPSIPGWVYGRSTDLDRIVLAPRYVNSKLVPQISEWPCIVNICVPKEGSDWECGPWTLLDIGELSIT